MRFWRLDSDFYSMEAFNENKEIISNPDDGEAVDIKQLLLDYLRYWPWFVLSVVLCLGTAYLYLRYATPIYSTSTEVKVLDENDDGSLDLSGLDGAQSLFNVSKIKLENEIQIMKSRRLMRKVVKNLGLNTVYSTSGTIKEVELFNNEVPFEIEWLKEDSTQIGTSEKDKSKFELKFKNSNSFRINENETKIGKYQFFDTINLPEHQIIVKPNPHFHNGLSDLDGKTYLFSYKSTESLIGQLSSAIQIVPVGDRSDVLNASMTGANKSRNEAILNSLIKLFNQDGIQDKQLVSKRTEEFIGNRLIKLSQELDTVESGMVNYKERNNLVTIESNTGQLLEKETAAETRRFDIEIQIAVAKQFKQTLENNKEYSLLPTGLGIESEGLEQLTASYNEVVSRRNDLLVSATPENPTVQNIDESLDRLRANIFQNIQSYMESQQILLKNLEQRENMSTGELKKIPSKAKQIRTIERQQKIKEELYLFLLQRREAAALKYATTTPTVKVVDYAYTDRNRVSPKTAIIFLGSLMIGLVIPIGFVYVSNLLDDKIGSKEQLQKLIKNVPVVAEIPHLSKHMNKLIEKNDRSVLAEAFRILRTNIAYLQSPEQTLNEQEGKVVLVTSSTKGEGKTFTAINLAISLASTDKKTLVIGCDLRNPQLHNYFGENKNREGVSNYLYDGSTKLEDLLLKRVLGFESLDAILSGEIPPNPAELLLSGRFQKLIAEAKQDYDYVIVDSAPTILVTDTLLISKVADLSVYAVRAGVTETKLLQHVKELQRDKKLNNMGVVINGIDSRKGYGYNYGYGYGYSEDNEKHSPFKFWKKG